MPRTILIADDSFFIRLVLQSLAEEAGWKVVAIPETGVEAVNAFQQHRPALVTLDLVMPELGGLDALARIKSLDPSARVVIVSDLEHRSMLRESMSAGACDFVVKPFDRARILDVLAREAGRNGDDWQT